ncbi:MAG TPA: SRPBCC family protein [Candidatus Saccharimonadales bacterium]|nr:SRPBCC family protein [Candidatus Saccharimonadales bacterium]
MKSNKLTIQINKSPGEIFDFVTDPANTPKWIDFIKKERTSEWPPKLGTIYKNQDSHGAWRDLELTEFRKNKMFVMTNCATTYHVRYSLVPRGDGITDLEYHEWMDEGELEDPFTIEPLKKLKSILEKSVK